MANLGHFFELVFAAKIYQRFNPENYSNLEITNKLIVERFNYTSLSSDSILSFLRNNKNLINNNKIKSSPQKYFNGKYKDTIKCSLWFDSDIDDIQQFIRNYTVKTNIEKDIIEDIIYNLRKGVKKISKFFLNLNNQYTNQNNIQLINIITETPGYKKYLAHHTAERIKKINNILNFDLTGIQEINDLIGKRDEYLLNEKRENLNFNIVMVGKTKIEGKVAKTDVKIELIVDWDENNKNYTKKYTTNISLKYGVPKIETASTKTLEQIQNYFNDGGILTESAQFKQRGIKFIFDNSNENDKETLIKLTSLSKNNIKRLPKLKLISILGGLDEKLFKIVRKYDLDGTLSLAIITYSDQNFLIFKKRINKKKIEYEAHLGNYLLSLMTKS